MRFFAVAAALFAAVVTAQNNAISIPEGQSTLEVTAGQPLTLDWTNPSSGTVTIKLQQQPITPDSGIILVSGVPASSLTTTVQIPDAADVNSFQYTIQIIDDTDADNYNFSPNFGIQGATGTATGTASTASATGTASTGSRTGSSTATDSTQTASSTETDSATTTGSSRTSSGTASSTSSATRSSAASSSSAAATTSSAPNSNDAVSGLKVQGGLVAMALGAMVAVM